MIPCKMCKFGRRILHQFGDVEYVCICPNRDHCESCKRDDVPKIVKVKA